MYKMISDNFITDTIARYNNLTDDINNRIEDVFSQIVSDSELMQVASMPGQAYDALSFSDSLAYDITDTYRKYRQMKTQQMLDARANIRSAMEKQETMNRIMVCYNILPENEHKTLEYLYERFNYKDGLAQLMKDCKVSESTALRRRTAGIKHIRELYGSDLSNTELYINDNKNMSKYR